LHKSCTGCSWRTTRHFGWLLLLSDFKKLIDRRFGILREERYPYSKGMRVSVGRGAAKVVILVAALFAAGCGSSNITDELNLTQVTFPNGVRINAETMRRELELMRGLMSRESLAPDRGMEQ